LSRYKTLKSLDSLLVNFLDRAVALKEERLAVLEGINRLDDIARIAPRGMDISDEMGEWFASHNGWLTSDSLRPGDVNRIGNILGDIKKELNITTGLTPAQVKIDKEIDRWSEKSEKSAQKLVLKRGPETKPRQAPPNGDTIALFTKEFTRIAGLFADYAENKPHLLTVLDDLLKSAHIQQNKDALILSAFIIYYLKQNGYMTEPYVKKLKEAETSFARKALDA